MSQEERCLGHLHGIPGPQSLFPCSFFRLPDDVAQPRDLGDVRLGPKPSATLPLHSLTPPPCASWATYIHSSMKVWTVEAWDPASWYSATDSASGSRDMGTSGSGPHSWQTDGCSFPGSGENCMGPPSPEQPQNQRKGTFARDQPYLKRQLVWKSVGVVNGQAAWLKS